jgi:phage baseplate assembly protein gpV
VRALVTPDLGQQLVVLTPADAETRERLELLRVLGTEEFAAGAPSRPYRRADYPGGGNAGYLREAAIP